MMRLDKFIVESGLASRTEITKVAKNGGVTVNGQVVRRASGHIDPTSDKVTYLGKEVIWREFTYVMLNKPDGYVSATDDDKYPTVITLLPDELQRIGLFPCGRLDKNTLGLMILTNNGPLSHKLLAPKNHVSKKYRFTVKFPISEDDVQSLESGVDIGGYVTAPCKVEMIGEKEGYITLTEGKYHQIKLMAEAVHNQITYLERVTFGPIALDEGLGRGEWRYLTEDEQKSLEAHGKIIKDIHA
ncbi:MAG: rRNA pseudouridine synthase [Clostridia bacterium]|nr:rRNA pseudouridine synthase [Clostridia bacterium]